MVCSTTQSRCNSKVPELYTNTYSIYAYMQVYGVYPEEHVYLLVAKSTVFTKGRI